MNSRPALALALLLVAAGLVVSRPLAREWSDGLPLAARAPTEGTVLTGGTGDTLQLYYQLWLLRDGLLGPTPLGYDPYQFRIDGPRWNLPQTFVPLALPFTVLSVFGLHLAYNLLVLLSFPLAGLAGYVLVRHYTGHGVAAAAAGAAFALVPARLGPLFGGHPAGFAAALVPLVFWGLDLALVRGRLAGGLIGGGATLALSMLEPHYTYLVGGLILAYAPLRWVGGATRRMVSPSLLTFALGAAAGAGWLLMLRQTFLVGSVAEAGRRLDEVRLFSPGPAALLAPATYGGLAILALALLGLATPSRREDRALRLLFGTALAVGLILSLGPTLPGIPLYQALHRWVPLFGLIRNPEKFRLLVSLGAMVLAGYGARALLARVPARVTPAAGLVLLAVVAVETAPWHPIAVTRFPGNAAVYGTLRRGARRVLYVPVWPGDSAWASAYLYHVTRTRVPMLNGYSPLVPRDYVSGVYGRLQGLNVGDLGTAEQGLLRELGVTHVVLDRTVFPPQASPFPSAFTRERLRASPALALERARDPLWVFRVTDEPPTAELPATSPVGLFFEAEALPRERGVTADEASASGGRIVTAREGGSPAGFLTFGPSSLLPAGAYRATFRTRGTGLALDVVAEQGQRVLAERRLTPSSAWEDMTIAFSLDHARRVELRVRWDGHGEAAADWVLVVFADRPEPEWTFEVEELPHRLGERPDPAASKGWAGYADPVESQRAPLVTGPARLYPAGRYRLALRVRAEGVARGPLLRLTVTEPAGRVLASRDVDASELPPDGYRDVGLDFALPRPTPLELPVWYLGGTGVFFDRLAVSPR